LRYCLDSNVLIQAKNGPYAFDIAPGFWKLLDIQSTAGIIYSSTLVYKELTEGTDNLADWVKDRKDTSLFVEPCEKVQKAFQKIADYVSQSYNEPSAKVFLDRADPWIIAQAKIDKAVVVTHEILVPNNSFKAKIPNICKQFGVSYVNTYEMLRRLKAKLAT